MNSALFRQAFPCSTVHQHFYFKLLPKKNIRSPLLLLNYVPQKKTPFRLTLRAAASKNS